MINSTIYLLTVSLLIVGISSYHINNNAKFNNLFEKKFQPLIISKVKISSVLTSLCIVYSLNTLPILATDQGANDVSNTKIKKGGASTLQQGQLQYS